MVDLESKKRDNWDSNLSFLFAAVGSAIGLGNVVRFPYLTYKHGGAAFFIPYLLCLFLLGIPILALEFMLGQRMQRGIVDAFANIHPRAWGLGVTALIGSFIINAYYNVIMAWSWVYLFESFRRNLRWGDTVESTEDFFDNEVLNKSADLENGLGTLNWKLSMSVIIQWTLVFLCTSKGVKTTEVVVKLSTPLPFIMLGILLGYGSSLDGAGDGVEAYIAKFEHESLSSIDPWVDAAGQIFFGLSVGGGMMVSYSSSQPKTAKAVSNTWIVALANSFCSIYAGFAVFCILGYLAHTSGDTVENVVPDSGFSLSFVTFPAAIYTMDVISESNDVCPRFLPVLWPAVFSIMVKFVTPTILFLLFMINMVQDFTENYGGYPGWAVGIFGWFMSVLFPLSAVVVGLFIPYEPKPAKFDEFKESDVVASAEINMKATKTSSEETGLEEASNLNRAASESAPQMNPMVVDSSDDRSSSVAEPEANQL
ncbi:hypothetical protein CYMTET_10800 [Cymbomonas tetramitiformis]|uniref:Uncharacterized protein n=1 Tax=Cymbomonas tetramitiformis TaxID=36881 RepID=A0AAE0GNM2_9CHLO|nr:hypothetical protein CYMTET_10800 [Cymbomonas tetramitiformis]